MITIRRYAEFGCDFPDDTIWDAEETSIVQTGGKNLAESIAELTTRFGCVINELEDNLEHCWECRFSYEGLELGFHVYHAEPCILIVDQPFGFKRHFPLYCHVLMELNQAMRRDGRFHDLEWHTYDGTREGKEAYEVPVVGDIPEIDEIKQKPSFLKRLFGARKARPEIE